MLKVHRVHVMMIIFQILSTVKMNKIILMYNKLFERTPLQN